MNTEAAIPPVAERRRALLYAAVGGAAAVAGAGLAIWRWGGHTASGQVDPSLWTMSFDTPAGAPMAMQSFRGKPLLLNFWATWCPPCVEEMPMLDAFYRRGGAQPWQVLGLAIDQPSAVRAFLARTPVAYPIGLAGFGGTELGKALGNESGGLPFTVAVSAAGAVLERKMGRLLAADLERLASRP